MLRGVFIGIDRYRSPIGRLSCCVSDATALGALFSDTHGSGVGIVLDEDATADRIRQELQALQDTAPEDLVVVSYSGHGTPDHRLVPVDADPEHIAGSCISLAEFAELLDAVPAKNL